MINTLAENNYETKKRVSQIFTLFDEDTNSKNYNIYLKIYCKIFYNYMMIHNIQVILDNL